MNNLPDVSDQKNNLWLRKPKTKQKKNNFSSVGLGQEQKSKQAFPLPNDSQVSQHKVIAKTQFNIASDFELQTYRDTMNHWIILPYSSLTPRQ